MSASTATFELPPNLAPFTAPQATFRESYDSTAGLIVGAFIFSYGRSNTTLPSVDAGVETTSPRPRLLLLQRTSGDAYGDRWDFPGGSVEKHDETIVDAVKREVLEETGLHVSEIVGFVGIHTWVDARPNRDAKRAKFSFTVKVAEEGKAGGPDIKLAQTEHQAFMWATEEDIDASLVGGEGALQFIDVEEIEIAAEAFRKFKHSSTQ